MKVRVISSRDPDVHIGMEGKAIRHSANEFLVTLIIKRRTTLPYKEKETTVVMLESELEFVEPQIAEPQGYP